MVISDAVFSSGRLYQMTCQMLGQWAVQCKLALVTTVMQHLGHPDQTEHLSGPKHAHYMMQTYSGSESLLSLLEQNKA